MLLPAYKGLLPIEPYRIEPSAAQLAELKDSVGTARIPSPTYESLHAEENKGIRHEWMVEAMRYWREEFDLAKQLREINEADQYVVDVEDDVHGVQRVHFAAHFSTHPDAIPLLLLHGWPGSFVEFLPLFKLLKESTSPHFSLVVPSQAGFGWSSDPPLDRDYKMEDAARQMDVLMRGLGFESYVVQGGDIGSIIARIMAVTCDAVKAVNINYLQLSVPLPSTQELAPLTALEQTNVDKAIEFTKSGRGYGVMHGTRPSTIGMCVQSSPVALLAWLGEKFIAWTDETPSLDTILTIVSLWWINETFPKAIYAYRQLTAGAGAWNQRPDLYITKPFGFSSFAHEIASAPQSWAAQTGNLQFYRYHQRGGHFAAMECPEAFAQDMQDCFGKLWAMRA